MNLTKAILVLIIITMLTGCFRNKLEPKGFSVSNESAIDNKKTVDGINNDSISFKTRPGEVLLTGNKEYRLTPIYKVNLNKKTNKTFIGNTNSYSSYIEYSKGNNWNFNFMPGIEAIYGYNMVNISIYNNKINSQKNIFDSPVLIKTLYFPSFSNDTLNHKPVNRNYYMISVYDEDTNNDGFINVHDLRRFYYFNLKAENKSILIPKNYSVISSQYDFANDYMYVYAKLDSNKNGKGDDNEEVHIYWIDLKNPKNKGKLY